MFTPYDKVIINLYMLELHMDFEHRWGLKLPTLIK